MPVAPERSRKNFRAILKAVVGYPFVRLRSGSIIQSSIDMMLAVIWAILLQIVQDRISTEPVAYDHISLARGKHRVM
jgi:hypothetical protein